MLDQEFIENWNEIFDVKLRESDLQHPTEDILTKILVAYLQKFGYEVPFPDAAENSREKRLFLIQLTQNIDRILKISKNTYSFMYYDLIRPVPKKTSHVLNVLLNYYHFFIYYKKEVFALANERLSMRQELLYKIESTEQENKERQQRAKEIEHEKITLFADSPQIRTKLDDWKAKTTHQKVDLEKVRSEIEQLINKLASLREKQLNLKKQIIDDDEAQQLERSVNELCTNIAEQRQKKALITTTIEERERTIKNLESLLKSLEHAKDILPTELLEIYEDLNKKIKKIEVQKSEIMRQKSIVLDAIAKQETELKSFKTSFKAKKQKHKLDKKEARLATTEKENRRDSKNGELEKLRKELNNVDRLFEEQMQLQDYIKDNISQIFSGGIP